MEPNSRAHPECVYASNQYHECGYACLERIANGEGRKNVKTLVSKLSNLASFGNKRKEMESRSKPPERILPIKSLGEFLLTDKNSPKDSTMAQTQFTEKSSAQHKKGSYSFSFFEEQSPNLYPQDDWIKPQRDQFSGPLLNHTPHHYKRATMELPDSEIMEEISGTVEGTQGFDLTTTTISGNNNNDDDDDDDDDEDDTVSVTSDSCVSVGKYHVKSSISSILQSIIDKHGDIAGNCTLESASMRARYLECLCSVVQELKSTPFGRLTKVRIKEMLAVLKDLETVNIAVDWLRNVLHELLATVEIKMREQEEVNRKKSLIASLAVKLELLEEDLVQQETEADEARERLDKTRARLRELEMDLSRVKEVQDKVENLRGRLFMDSVI